MKTLYIILTLGLLVGFSSCKDAVKTETTKEEVSKPVETTKSDEPKSTVKNEVQVGDQKLVYKVSLGVLPDLAYKGIGMKAAKVHKDRPGFLGGMLDGDIVIKIDGKPVKDLIEYTKLLGSLKKGDKAILTLKRGDKILNANIKFD